MKISLDSVERLRELDALINKFEVIIHLGSQNNNWNPVIHQYRKARLNELKEERLKLLSEMNDRE